MKQLWDSQWETWQHDSRYECRTVVQVITSTVYRNGNRCCIDYEMMDGKTKYTYLIENEYSAIKRYQELFESGHMVVGKPHKIVMKRLKIDRAKKCQWLTVELLCPPPAPQQPAKKSLVDEVCIF